MGSSSGYRKWYRRRQDLYLYRLCVDSGFCPIQSQETVLQGLPQSGKNFLLTYLDTEDCFVHFYNC